MAVTTPQMPECASACPAARQQKIAYVMSRFPKLTETFVLYEIIEMERQGVPVEIYPLQREHVKVMHRDAEPLVRRAHFAPFLSWAILKAQGHYLWRCPITYFSVFLTLLWANLGSLRFFLGALVFFPKAVFFARCMARTGVTHLHAHFASHPAAVAYVIHRLTGLPFSFTAHGSDLHRDRHMLRQKVAAARFVVAVSKYNREMILRECGDHWRNKVTVVHCGVDADLFRPRVETTSHERGETPPAILCTGTLHEVKGQTYLIDACRKLRDWGIAFTCHFAGGGPDARMLKEQIAEARLEDCVFLHGQQTREQVLALIKSADVVVAPSVRTQCGRREGIPVVLIEAMGSGVPVVASRLSGIPELVEHDRSGLLAPPRDAAAIAKAIQRLLNDPALRRRLGEAGCERVRRDFDLKTNAAQLALLFGSFATDRENNDGGRLEVDVARLQPSDCGDSPLVPRGSPPATLENV